MKLVRCRDYQEYVEIQTKANKRKLHVVWATDKEIAVVSKWIKRHMPDATFGICHGAKHGWEVEAFRKRLGIEVIGTDISDNAATFPHMLQWDFHEVKEEWVGNVDFIYSNALDHSYDPRMCLDRWMKCLKPTGRCFVEWTPYHDVGGCSQCDCFAASMQEYREMLCANHEIDDLLTVKTWFAFPRLLPWKLPMRTRLRRRCVRLKRFVFVVKHGQVKARAA